MQIIKISSSLTPDSVPHG